MDRNARSGCTKTAGLISWWQGLTWARQNCTRADMEAASSVFNSEDKRPLLLYMTCKTNL